MPPGRRDGFDESNDAMMPDSWMIGGEGREAVGGAADVQMHRSADGRFGKQHAGMMKEVRVAAFRGDPQAVQEVLQRMRVGGPPHKQTSFIRDIIFLTADEAD